MSKTMKIIIGIVFVLLVFYLIGSRNNPKVNYSAPSQTDNVQSEFKQAYMEGCIEEGGNNRYCDCTWQFLLDEYGFYRILDISTDYLKTNEIPEELNKAVKHCL